MMDPVFFTSATAFRSWLASNGSSSSELFVGFYKVATGRLSLSWSESVDEALCFGWIDGRRQRIDATSYSIRFTPRKRSSIWSTINILKVERLRAEHRMTPAGEQAFVRRSNQRSGVYYHEQTRPAELSPDELHVFKADLTAWAFYSATTSGYRKRIVHWVTAAKKSETRAVRFSKLVNACRVGVQLA